MSGAAPSGEQFVLRRGRQHAVAVEVGGGIRSYSAGGFDVLDGYPVEGSAGPSRGAVLVPWPNRLRDGAYEFGGRCRQLPLTEPARRTAIHGLARWLSWDCTDRRADRVRLRTVLHPQPGYEFTLEVEVEYALADGGLEAAITARNRGREVLPYGAGAHPYLRAAQGPIDGQVLRSPARRRLPLDARMLPAGPARPVAGRYDFRRGRAIGATILDTPFTDLERGAEGLARVELSSPERRVTLWADASFDHLMLFTGDTLGPGERRSSLAVEPMTCAPDAFNSGHGLVLLEPGRAHVARWGITVES